MRKKKDLRLFFALWPGEGVREKIAQSIEKIPAGSGRLVPPHNWHMTLHFIGNTTFAEKDCLHRQARKVRTRPFELSLDQMGFFKKSKVFWLGISETPNALIDLQKNLGREISHCDYQPEIRPYSPHITVLRKTGRAPELKPVQPFVWKVDKFVLIESISGSNGVHYEVLENYRLDKIIES